MNQELYPKERPYNPLEGERPEHKISLDNLGSEERISIIIVHKDRPEYLNICLQTITITSISSNFELIVVDNGSGPRTQSFLDDLEEDGVKVVRNDTNLWWAKAANQGAKAADKNSQYLVFMHHDMCVLNPVWLDLLLNVSASKNSGVVGVKMKYYEIDDQRIPFIDESCMLVSRECWKDVGPFNEELEQEGAPFLFTVAANRKGYNPQAIDQTRQQYIHHFRTFALSMNEYERMSERMRRLLPKLITELQST